MTSTLTKNTSPLLGRYSKELKALVFLGGPILGAQLSTTGMTFVDTSMAGQYSAQDLAAVALGSSIWMPIYLLVRGIMMATTPTVAQLFGAGNIDRIATPVRQAYWVAVLFSVLAILFLLDAGPLLDFLQIEPEVSEITRSYLAALAWGVPAVFLYQVMACYCEARSLTKPGMLFSFAALLLNIPVNYVLIYGRFGFPELGSVGCGYATAICFWLMTVLMFFYTRFDERHKDADLYGQWEWPSLSAIKAHMKLGVPMGLTTFFEASIFSAIALVIGQLGAITVAGHQVALNFTSLCFMVPMSISMGITIRVGQALGAKQFEQARFTAFAGIVTTSMAACVSASVMWFLPDLVADIYTNDLAVKVLAAELLMFAAMFQFVDGVQVASNGALRGYKDTRVPMIMIMVACWGIALPFGYILGLTDWLVDPMGPHGLWIGLVAALTLAATFLALRLNAISKRYCNKLE
ncbi:MATE family efflux transporter [Endozoicomonas gorgoniicola]|uniref:Multidrug-efflux transporter n=1 Tax=Endozoicomonas gorgoniicola TaxID=1234144 RepID=A0ABT3N284_9GAMM|nr:MATE family efflux transporter [Endozoicomonas gorgoniicola]MCW7555745.1 MATE family efflux transporter [Endozoicomonas gorgoniicola]